ncbi:hypothetical protein [Actinoplanes rectilineatus]|uniref:hypothetical protein n=1 Tax=Actinoplanes rectilineatus TaxID=113571 RepID=UPI0005F2BC75|nr:hypothetical protein [Actinoplanes rectilineatus]
MSAPTAPDRGPTHDQRVIDAFVVLSDTLVDDFDLTERMHQLTGYRNAGQCSGLQAGGEGPRWEGRQARAVP